MRICEIYLSARRISLVDPLVARIRFKIQGPDDLIIVERVIQHYNLMSLIRQMQPKKFQAKASKQSIKQETKTEKKEENIQNKNPCITFPRCSLLNVCDAFKLLWCVSFESISKCNFFLVLCVFGDDWLCCGCCCCTLGCLSCPSRSLENDSWSYVQRFLLFAFKWIVDWGVLKPGGSSEFNNIDVVWLLNVFCYKK